MYACVCMHMEVGGRCWLSSSIIFHPLFWDQIPHLSCWGYKLRSSCLQTRTLPTDPSSWPLNFHFYNFNSWSSKMGKNNPCLWELVILEKRNGRGQQRGSGDWQCTFPDGGSSRTHSYVTVRKHIHISVWVPQVTNNDAENKSSESWYITTLTSYWPYF